MRSKVIIFLLLFSATTAYALDCEVVSISQYQDLKGSGDRESVNIHTNYCASFTIMNNAAGGRLDPVISVSFANGKAKTVKLKTGRIEPGSGYNGAKCFGSTGAPISDMTCSW